jgi:hypothetical protein
MKNENYVGVGIAIGTGVGAALFAATNEAYWIGVGIALGAAFGATMSQRSGGEDESD